MHTHTQAESRCMLTHKIDLSGCVFVVAGGQIYKTHMYLGMAAVEIGLQLRLACAVGGCEMPDDDDDADDGSDGGVTEKAC